MDDYSDWTWNVIVYCLVALVVCGTLRLCAEMLSGITDLI